MRPRIAKLRHRLTLEAPIATGDGGGGAVIAWEAVAQIWGAVEAPGGGEDIAADRVSGTRQAVVTIRHRDDVTPAARFRFGSRLLAIRAALDPDGRQRFLRCLCEERDL
jgi:SPP1 family predicted phage head-tail adaptor